MIVNKLAWFVVVLGCGSGGGSGGGGGGSGAAPVDEKPSCEVAAKHILALIEDPGNLLASKDPDVVKGNQEGKESWTRLMTNTCERDNWSEANVACFSKQTAKPELEKCKAALTEKQRESMNLWLGSMANELASGAFVQRMTKPGKKTYRIGKDGTSYDVTVTLPADWNDKSRPEQVVIHTMSGSWIKVSTTCHGGCGDAEALAKNIAQVAKERFDFTQSDSFHPKQTSEWELPVTEKAPKEWHYTFKGHNKEKDWGIKYITVDRIVDDRIVHCTVEMTSKNFDQLPAVESLCAKLEVAKAK